MTRQRISHTRDFHIYGVKEVATAPASTFKTYDTRDTVCVTLQGRSHEENVMLYFVEGREADGLEAIDQLRRALRKARADLQATVDARARAAD